VSDAEWVARACARQRAKVAVCASVGRPDTEDGRWPRRVDANSFARKMHEEQASQKERRQGEVATGCDELRGATHDELPRTTWKRRGAYGAASRNEKLRSEGGGQA
jgi:hypothetical protein